MPDPLPIDDPIIRQVGVLAGILKEQSGGVGLNDAWFGDPLGEVQDALTDESRREALLQLLQSVLGSSNSEVLGLPGSGEGESWYPINDPAGQPTGLYIVARNTPAQLHLGLGVRWSTDVAPLTVGVWAHVPLLTTDGTTGGTNFSMGQGTPEAGSPVQLALEITHQQPDGFGFEGLHFQGVKLAARLVFTPGVSPDVSFVFRNLQLPDGQPASDRSLADLSNVAPREWIEMAVSLFTAQLGSPGASGLIRDHLLPLLGVSGSPSIRWEMLPEQGLDVVKDWMLALIDDPAHMQAWLDHWKALLASDAGSTAVNLAGAGTRTDPWRVGVSLGGGSPVTLLVTMATATVNGARTLYPGLMLTTPPVTISGNTKLSLEAALELAAIHLSAAATVEPLPAVDVRARLFDTTGANLVSHTFVAPDPLEALGTFTLKEVQAGLSLNESLRPVPSLKLINLSCARGSWPVLDLSSADAVIDDLSSLASTIIQTQIENALTGSTPALQAGRHVAALLGIVRPSSAAAPDPWPVPLVFAPAQVAQFLGDPLGAIACYHSACIETNDAAGPLWRFLMEDLAALLRHSSVAASPLSGAGTQEDPWSVTVYEDAAFGTAALQTWAEVSGGRPQLAIALDAVPNEIDLGGGVGLTLHQRTQLLRLDLPPTSACPGTTFPVWLPSVGLDLTIEGDEHITTPPVAGLQLGLDSLRLGAVWEQRTNGLDWFVMIRNPSAEWDGAFADSITLPHLRFSKSFIPAWDFTAPDFGLGVPFGSVDPLGSLLSFIAGRWLMERGGSFGFGLAGLLGWLPNLPDFEFPDMPEWSESFFALPSSWPQFTVESWPAFFSNPWPDIRLHLGRLLQNPEWAWPALRWIGASLHGMLPDLSLPDLGWPRFGGGGGGSPINIPDFSSIPFSISGAGTYEDPWAVTVNRPATRGVELLIWLDPSGPTGSSVVDVALSLLPQNLRSFGDLVGQSPFSYANLVEVLSALSNVDHGLAGLDRGLKEALVGTGNAELAEGLETLGTHLLNSDGVVLTVSQQLTNPSWNAPAALNTLPEAFHGAQLENDAIATAIKNKIDEWSGADNLPVILIGAPWEDSGAWAAVLNKFGVAPAASRHFDLFETGVDPEQISLDAVTAGAAGGARFYTASIAVFNTAPGVPFASRALPVSAGGDASSQAKQVKRLVERVRALQGGERVIVVAHSSSGLAARAAFNGEADNTRVRGLITVGTPHIASPLPWLADDGLAQALAFLNRLDSAMLPNEHLRRAAKELLKYLDGEMPDGVSATPPLGFPAHAFQPAGAPDLPAGVDGHTLATRLPQIELGEQMIEWLQSRLTALRDAVTGRTAVSHVGFGVRVLPPAAGPGVRVETSVRLDAARVKVVTEEVDASGYVSLPRLTVHSKISRPNGWLVGDVGISPRLRWAELGLVITRDEPTGDLRFTPVVRLHDGFVEGVAAALSELEPLPGGGFNSTATTRRLLDEVMRRLTRETEVVPEFRCICELLQPLGLTMAQDGGFAFDQSGWSGLLGDPTAFLQTQASALLSQDQQREAFFGKLRACFDVDASGFGALFSASPTDPPHVACLREVLAEIGLLTPAGRGYVLKLSAWLALVRNPAAALQSLAEPFLQSETRRTALLNTLRTRLNLNDTTNRNVEHLLGSRLSFSVSAAGSVSLCVPSASPFVIGSALNLAGCLRLDLAARRLSVEAKLNANTIRVGLASVYALTAPAQPATPAARDWKLRLDWGEGLLPAPYQPLDIFPIPADFAERLGEMIPRFALSTISATLLETQLLAQVPAAGTLLECLGLAYRPAPAAGWRVRPLDGLLVDPVGWLMSPQVLGTTGGQVDPAKVLCVVNNLAKMLGQLTPAGGINLPFGLRVQATAGPPVTLAIQTDIELAPLPDDARLALNLLLTIGAGGHVGVGGDVRLRASLPADANAVNLWDDVIVEAGFAADVFTVRLGTTPSPGASPVFVNLLPFSGWDAALLNLAGGVTQLLPTMIKAAVRALQARDAAAGAFVNDLLTAAAALDLDDAAGLNALVADPVSWLQDRFSSANATASATALATLFTPRLPGLTRNAGLLTYQPGATPVQIKLGRDGALVGVRVVVTNLATGPLLTTLGAHVGVGDEAAPAVETGVALDLAVAPDVIAPAGVSIEPRLHFSYDGGADAFDVHLYPLGDAPDSPDFRLNVLPSFQFFCEDGAVTDCLLAFARRILAPMTLEIFLDSAAVTQWLNTPLVGSSSGVEPGEMLKGVGVLEDDGGGGFNLKPFDQLPTPERFVSNLFGVALGALHGALNNGADPLVSLDGGGIFLTKKAVSGADVYGVRVALPDITVSEDPEIVLVFDGATDWITRASSPPVSLDAGAGGISLYLVSDAGAGDPRYTFTPELDLVSVGFDLSGKNDNPLLNIKGFRLGGLDLRVYLALTFPNFPSGPAEIRFGMMGELDSVGIPLGSASGGNPVAQNLIAPGAGAEKEPLNPSFGLALAYVDRLDVELTNKGPDGVAWFPIQATFGPVHVQQVGVRWDDAAGPPGPRLTVLVDGGVSLSGLAVGLDDLSITIPVRNPLALGQWQLGLKGLAIAYEGGGVRIAGGLRQAGTAGAVRYDGLCLIEVGGKTFVAIGSYMQDPFTSLFIFVLLPIIIGGPPYFFIIGLAGGVGYNRGLLVPPVEGVPEFPLIAAATGSPIFSEDPMSALVALGEQVPPERGSYWLAAGVRFTSFELVRSVALLYVVINRGLEVGLLGLAQMELPEGAPLVNVELALKVRFSTVEGLLSVEARLTDNSWVLSRDCRLTGGFAFFIWFAGPHAGDVVLTLGGYHPRFNKPAHFPNVPRLGFNWRVSSNVTIKGESYFALTTSCVMAGGRLEAVFQAGSLRAWFTCYADFLISWKPFAYDIQIGCSIGVSYRVSIRIPFVGRISKTFSVELSADVHIWGPELAGTVDIRWYIISFTVSFGANDAPTSKTPISWGEFRAGFLPAKNEDLFFGSVEAGLIEVKDKNTDPKWQMKTEFVLRTETALAANALEFGTLPRQTQGFDMDIRPMALDNVTSVHQVRIRRGAADVTNSPLIRFEKNIAKVPAALWDFEDRDEEASAKTVDALVGGRVVARIDEDALDGTGQIPVTKIFETGTHPLPFALEIAERGSVSGDADSSDLLSRAGVTDAVEILRASRLILRGEEWRARRDKTLKVLADLGADVRGVSRGAGGAYLERTRSAPPVIASLYEGMAAETVTDVPVVPVPPRPVEVAPRKPLVPRFKAVIRQRPEVTRAKTNSIRTSVDTIAGAQELQRSAVGKSLSANNQGASLRRVAHPRADRATNVAAQGRSFSNSAFASRSQQKQFLQFERQAIFTANETEIRATAFNGAADVGRGVEVQAGTTQVWELPSRDTVGGPPEIVLDGDQAVRVTCLSKGSALLDDVEMVGRAAYRVPERTAWIAITGLGRTTDRFEPEHAMGAVTLARATNPVAVVGWQAGLQLVQVNRSTLVGRGAVLRTGAPLLTRSEGRRVENGLVKASDAMAGQFGVETHLPPQVQTIAVMLGRRGDAAEGSLGEGFSMSVQGADVSERPLTVAGGSVGVLLYDVLRVEEARKFISVALSFKVGWGIEGVLGLRGGAAHWSQVLANQSLDTLVESGPLTPQGSTRVAFRVDAPEPTDR